MSDGDDSTGASFVKQGQEYDRDMTYIPDRITLDARKPDHGPVEGDLWPVEPGRYRLVATPACPWANRSLIVHRLLGLEDVISLGLCGPTHDERSWNFSLDPGEVDPVLGYHRLEQAYLARDPGYSRGITVPAVVDVRRRWSSPTTSRGSRTTSTSSGATTTAATPQTSGPTSSARRWSR